MTVRVEPQSNSKKSENLQNCQFLTPELDEIEKLKVESHSISFTPEYVYRNIVLFSALHFGALIGAYQLLLSAKWTTVFWVLYLHVVGSVGVTAGAHRLWSHRSYKARWPMRLLLMLMNNVALQNDIIEWARDHRCHHKWTDTDADPHSTSRGYFFAHIGWLLLKKHPQVKEKGAKLDLSDLYSDPILIFQRKNYIPLVLLFCFILPTVVPVYLWGENALIAFYTAAIFRYCFTLNVTWCVNSVSHWVGWKPYDQKISAVENIWTTVTAVGEGGHNYHHAFPQDYRTSEYTWTFNWTKLFIDSGAVFGLVYNRKVASEDAIQHVKHNMDTYKVMFVNNITLSDEIETYGTYRPRIVVEADASLINGLACFEMGDAATNSDSNEANKQERLSLRSAELDFPNVSSGWTSTSSIITITQRYFLGSNARVPHNSNRSTPVEMRPVYQEVAVTPVPEVKEEKKSCCCIVM
ncbi:unnamed protein product [Caenorhabditis auriculariae]|uniref:Fatty acid desaturase domain-containing protein n=1 Tax=Caenorhabditis auriculariae TaxID=2777116 RepID=A0A8S1HEQ1_9PELO|nr:unnamed protein product [Caenorhabditis auriculariae]